MTTFTRDPKESRGKTRPTLHFCGEPLKFELNPTFLGLQLDGQLTFSTHIESLKKKMAKRRACLTALAGKSYGCHRRTLRIAYLSYIRSVFDYGAAIFFNHAAPEVRDKLEVEQRKCARVITGCIKLTEKAAEVELTPLTIRAKELAAREYGRLCSSSSTRRPSPRPSTSVTAS